MLVQTRKDTLRLITQHDHGLMSGEMAHRWRGLDSTPPNLSGSMLMAISLHDYPWVEEDRQPRLNGSTGTPYDFTDHPVEVRLAFYSQGLDLLNQIHPYAALLTSIHYCSFASGEEVYRDFLDAEKLRQLRLKKDAGIAFDDPLYDSMTWLRYFDNLSLFLCLNSPEVLPESCPPWLTSDLFTTLPGGEHSFQYHWEGENKVVFDPFPFSGPFTLTIPYRELDKQTFADSLELGRAWDEASCWKWDLKFAPA